MIGVPEVLNTSMCFSEIFSGDSFLGKGTSGESVSRKANYNGISFEEKHTTNMLPQMSHEKKTWLVGLYRDYNKPL